jgi:hypothetical protein
VKRRRETEPRVRFVAGAGGYVEVVPDLLDLLAADHDNLEGIGRDELVKSVLEHLWIERELLHPAIQHHVADGESIVKVSKASDDRVEDRLSELADAANGADEEQAEAAVRSALAEHIRAQNDLFPRLRDSIPAEVLEDLGDGVPLAIGGAPTRPHGARPEGFFGDVAEDVAAARDHFHDLFRHRDRG